MLTEGKLYRLVARATFTQRGPGQIAQVTLPENSTLMYLGYLVKLEEKLDRERKNINKSVGIFLCPEGQQIYLHHDYFNIWLKPI